jgi:enoyl-CoA hydratase
MRYSNDGNLRVSLSGHVLTATIDNPPANAIDPPLHKEIEHLFQAVEQDDDVRVLVLTGAGEKSFSAGGDLKAMADDFDDPRRSMWLDGLRSEKTLFQSVLNLSKPFVARVNGHAMGLGATLAVLADISIMAENAKIADPHVKVGLCAGDGGALLWPLMIGFAQARRLVLTGTPLTGREAADLGLVTEAVAPADLDARVDHYVQLLANGPSIAINHTKMAVNLLLRTLVDGLIEAHYGLEVKSALSEDHRIAIRAALDGTNPEFTGR